MSLPRRPSSALPPELSPGGNARLLLGVAVVVTMAGFLIAVLRGAGSGWNSWLFLEQELSHRAASQIDLALVLVGFAAAVLGLIFRHCWWGGCLMLPAFLYLVVNSCLIAKTGGIAHADWTPAAHALRYGTPLALVLLVVLKERVVEIHVALLLRVAVAVVFLTHGIEALVHHARYIDLIIGSGENLLEWRITEGQAKVALTVIGVLDVVVAVLVLVRPFPALLWWIVAWGLITALSRMTSLGWGAYPEVLTRSTHFLVPLALVHWCHRK